MQGPREISKITKAFYSLYATAVPSSGREAQQS